MSVGIKHKRAGLLLIVVGLVCAAFIFHLHTRNAKSIIVGDEAFQECFTLVKTKLALAPAFEPVFLSQSVSHSLMGNAVVEMVFEIEDGFIGSRVPYKAQCMIDDHGMREPKIRKY